MYHTGSFLRGGLSLPLAGDSRVRGVRSGEGRGEEMWLAVTEAGPELLSDAVELGMSNESLSFCLSGP